MCLINNYKIIAKNVSAIFCALLSIYGDYYSYDELIFMSCIIDAERYIKNGSITVDDISSVFPEAMAGVCGQYPFYSKSHESDLSSPTTRLVCAIMQLEHLIFMVDTKAERYVIVDSIVRHKRQISETLQNVAHLKYGRKYYTAVEAWVRRCISERWFLDAVLAHVERGTIFWDDENDAYPSVGNSVPLAFAKSNTDFGQRGAIGGWLLFLLIRIIGGIIAASYSVFYLWSRIGALSGSGISALGFAFLAVFSQIITVICMLRRDKSFRTWFIISVCLNLFYCFSFFNFADAISVLLVEGAWIVYLFRSKRVKAHCAS